MANASTFYRKKLPHLQPVGRTFFITYRLKDSIPKQSLNKLLLKQQEDFRVFEKTKPSTSVECDFFLAQMFAFDDLLDRIKSGPHHLNVPVIAKNVTDKIKSYDGQFYDLLAYCVMSNHVHLLIDTSIQLDANGKPTVDYVQLNEIMRLLKGSTAREANKILGRSGSFWETESYDHCVRDYESLSRILTYIMENPLKAGLVDDWRKWPHSYAKGYL